MDRERIMEAMGHIDPALVEAADRSVSAAGRGRRGWTRAAVIAACLCLVFAGTALAVELSGVRIADFFNHELRSVNPGWEPENYSGYAVERDVVYFPIDVLSPEIAEIDRSAERTVCRSFSSWEDMEEFVGLDIMENTALEGAPAAWTFDLGIEGGRGRYVACVNAYADVGVSRILVNGSFLLHGRRDGIDVGVEAEIFTERMGEEGPGEYATYFPNEAEVSSEEYVTSGGPAVQLFRVYTPEYESVEIDMETGEKSPCTVPPRVCYDARLVLNGISFRVTVSGESERETLLRETIMEVLDGFVCDPAA